MSRAPQIFKVNRGEIRPISVDFGETTAGQLDGVLTAGETLSSATVATCSESGSKPSTDDLTYSSATVNATTIYVQGRACSAGEAVSFTVTIGANQTYGNYLVDVVGTTAAGIVSGQCLIQVTPKSQS